MRQSTRTSSVLSTLWNNSQGRTFFFLVLSQICLRKTGHAESVDNRACPIFGKIDSRRIADIPCRNTPFAMNFGEVILGSAWVRSNVLATTTAFFRFFDSPRPFPYARMHTYYQVWNSLLDEKNTQVDASNHRHSLLDNHPFYKRSIPAGCLRRVGRAANPCPVLWILVYFLDRVAYHTYLLESADLILSAARNLHCFFFLCQRRALQVVSHEKRIFSKKKKTVKIN